MKIKLLEKYINYRNNKILNEDNNILNIDDDIKKYIDKGDKYQRDYYKRVVSNIPDYYKGIIMKKGRKFYTLYIKDNSMSVFCFIDKDGNIYKPASATIPAKGIRGNIYNENVPIDSGQLYRNKIM